METLKAIDSEIDKQLNSLKTIIEQTVFKTQLTFKLRDDIKRDKINELSFSGVYLIEIKLDGKRKFNEWLDEFKEKWEDKKFKKSFVPNTKKKRIKQHDPNKQYSVVPIYIGRAKNIAKRINEHLDLELGQPTTSLKLRSRKNIYGATFRINTIEIEVNNYDLISTQYEKELRDRINPIIGRQ